jgi:hypothetical protein
LSLTLGACEDLVIDYAALLRNFSSYPSTSSLNCQRSSSSFSM